MESVSMTHLRGLGGAFICSDDPARLAAWYTDKLGFEFTGDPDSSTFYTMFWTLAQDDPSRRVNTTFSIMPTKIPLPQRAIPEVEPDDMYGDQPYMLNLRVRDLAGFIKTLAAEGVPVIQEASYPYGHFAWIRDIDGHRIELYEPATTLGPRVLSKEIIVDAPRAEVWKRWTTVEGVTSFFAREAHLELRTGGAFEMIFLPDAPEGHRGLSLIHISEPT